MWTKITTIKDLEQSNRWKVELFTKSEERMLSAYDMVSIRSILTERKENIKPIDYPNEKFNYIGLENVTPLTGDLKKFVVKKGEQIKSTTRVFHKGDVLYGRLRPYLNKVYLAIGDIEEGVCSGEFHVLKMDTTKVKPYFIRTVLSSSYVQSYVNSMQTGSALPRLGINDLLDIEIPIPPLDIQEEIEDYLIKKTKRLKHLKRELEELPNKMISEVVLSLEEGESKLS